MSGAFQTERTAIETLRDKYPAEGQWAFAKRIRERHHFIGEDLKLAATCSGRTFLSILSVVRRYDAKVERNAVNDATALAFA